MQFNFLREPTVPRTPPSTLMEISEGGVRVAPDAQMKTTLYRPPS